MTAGSQPVHTLGECTSHEIAVLIEVVDTLLHGLRQLRKHETNSTVHGNTAHAAKQLAQARSGLLNFCCQSCRRFLENIDRVQRAHSAFPYLKHGRTKFFQFSSAHRKSFRERTANLPKHRLEYTRFLSNLLHSMSGFLYAAGSLLHAACSGFGIGCSVHSRCNTRRRNSNLRDFHIPNFLQITQSLSQIFQSFNISQADFVQGLGNLIQTLRNGGRNLGFTQSVQTCKSLAQAFQLIRMEPFQRFIQLIQFLYFGIKAKTTLSSLFQLAKACGQCVNTFSTFFGLRFNLKLKTLKFNCHC